MRRNRRKNKFKSLLVLLLLGVSIGFALLNSNLKIVGHSGINKNTWDIHWNSESLVESPGSVTAKTAAHVDSEDNKNVEFDVELELPGDYYEFTVDAKNYGSIDGIVSKIDISFYDTDGVTKLTSLPSYLKYTFTYADGTAVEDNKVILSGLSEKYRMRIEFDSEATEIPTTPTPIKPVIKVDHDQFNTRDKYILTFNTNGGTPTFRTKTVVQGNKIDSIPGASRDGYVLLGWYTGETDGVKIDKDTVPSNNTTYYAHWRESEAIFDTGTNVNQKFKVLAGTEINQSDPYATYDYNITSILRSETIDESLKTDEHKVSSSTSKLPIYAWFDNGTIYYYSEAEVIDLNEDASHMFDEIINVSNIDMNFDSSNTKNMAYMFAGIGHYSTNPNPTIDFTKLKTGNVENMNNMFGGTAIPTGDFSKFDTSKVTDMGQMFAGSKFKILDVSSFDVSNVVNFMNLFAGGSGIESIDIHGWNFAKAESLSSIFGGCSGLKTINLTGIDTSNVTDMSSMFSGCNSITSLDVSPINIENAENIAYMFSGCTSLKNLDIHGWNFNKFTNLSNYFSGVYSLETINFEGVNTSKVTSLYNMFSGCYNLKEIDLSSFDISNVTSIGGMFSGCTALKSIKLDNWNFDKVTSLSGLFQNLGNLETVSMKNVNTSKITDMSYMFYYCSKLTSLDLTSFDTKSVTNMSTMFANSSTLKTINVSDDFVVDQVSSSNGMFGGCTSIEGGLGTTYDYNHVDKTYAHYDEGEDNPGYFNAADVVTVTFNPNGGEVEPTTKIVPRGKKIKNLPTATKDGENFKAWFTDLTAGIKVDENFIVEDDITLYARWYTDMTINYDANTGKFENNETTKAITYGYATHDETKYSHTPNIDDTGVASGSYASNLSITDVVTMPGSSQLEVEVWFSTESQYWDYVAIYPKGITPNTGNTSSSISGQLGGGSSMSKPADSSNNHKTFTIEGDTVQFFFKSDSSGNYYGYYAIIRGQAGGYAGDKEYAEPEKENYRFLGWTKNSNNTGKVYETEDDIKNNIDEIGDNGTVYAKWIDEYTITFNPNGGEVDETTRKIIKDEKIGDLPKPTRTGYAFTGWYTDITAGTKVDKNYVPNETKTLYAHWNEIEAMFDTGVNVSKKLKELAGTEVGESHSYGVADTNITAIKRATVEPDTSTMTDEDNVISDSTSKYKIYAWYDNGTIYWWSRANKEYLNADASFMFGNMKNLADIDILFDSSQTTNMSYMFSQINGLESIDLRSFDTNNLTNMNQMFSNSKFKSINMSGFDTSNVGDMRAMFTSCSELETLNMSNFDFRKYYATNWGGTLMAGLTSGSSLKLKTIILDDAILPENCANAFGNLSDLEVLSLNNVNTSEVTTMDSMFQQCRKLTSLDLSSFDTSNVGNMTSMFSYCSSLVDLNITSFDVTKINNMYDMFYYCESIVVLDLSSFNPRELVSMNNAFSGMSSLTTIYVKNNFNFHPSSADYIFYNDTNLVGGNGTTYTSYTTSTDNDTTRARIDEPNKPGYFTLKSN